ncbi:MAG: HAD family phosphatase [Spirochaetales bacterium]|nr:MAG: HAD family phosphatase [Spirochaetales bacterium]
MFQLLATDIDGTLLAPDGSLPPANRDALRRLHQAGVTIVFCSGRSDASIRGIASRILEPADDEYYIAFNGARTVTADTRTLISSRYVTPSAVRRVVEYSRDHGLYLQGYVEDAFLTEVKTEFTDRYAEATQTDYQVVADLADVMPQGSPKLLLVGAHEVLVPHRDALLSMGQGADGFSAMFSKPHYLEIVASGVDKGDALTRLAERLGIPREATFAVGDGDNDVEMIQAAGTGIAVNGSSSRAIAAADVVLNSSSEDGVMTEILERFAPSGI